VDKLTEFENHRTNTQFEDAYCSKLFSFVFVNSYLSVLYIAFVAEHMPKVRRVQLATSDLWRLVTETVTYSPSSYSYFSCPLLSSFVCSCSCSIARWCTRWVVRRMRRRYMPSCPSVRRAVRHDWPCGTGGDQTDAVYAAQGPSTSQGGYTSHSNTQSK